MNHPHVSSIRSQFLTFLVATLLLPGITHAASLTISPTTVAANYSGAITLNVTGLTTGQTVRVETFLDTNGNGGVDSGEMLLQSFEVTDGQALSIGGVRNVNVPGDEDGQANDKIRAVLNFRALAEVLMLAPNQVYKVSPLGGGSEQTKAFTITQPYSQGVTGKVKNGGSAVPFALVFLVSPTSGGPVGGTLSDASGNFTLKGEPGSYMLGAAKSGFVFDFNEAPEVTIEAGATVTQDVALTAANHTISGRLTDANSGDGIPAVQMTAEAGDPGLFTLAITDANGDFNIPVSSAVSQWGLWTSEKSAALLGYLGQDDSYPVDIGGGSVSEVPIEWRRAESLVWGTLKDGQGHGLAGVQIEASNDQDYGVGLTDSSGNYVVGTGSGDWWVGPSSDDLASRGYFAQGVNLTLGVDEARQVNFVAQQFTSHLIGRVTDDSGHAVDNVCINAYPTQGGGGTDATTDGDGDFSLGVFGGTWNISLCSEDAQARGLVRPTLSFNVADGADVTGIQYVAKRATAQIGGWVRDATTNAPLAGVGVGGHITAGSVNYDPWGSTDSDGNYSLGVFNGTWSVDVSCYDLQSRGYACVDGQSVSVPGGGAVTFRVVRAASTFTPTPTHTPTPTITSTPPTPPTPGACVGDCSGDGHVTVDELIKGVNIALGSLALDRCPKFDCNGNGNVTVDCLVKAVNAALSGCVEG
jgi:hypothetical protein